MNVDKYLNDLEYTAIRFSGGLSYRIVNELVDSSLISSYKEINIKNLCDLLKNKDISRLSDKTKDVIKELIKKRDGIKYKVDSYIESINKNNIGIVSCDDDLYPKSWMHISGMPKVIFTRGNQLLLDCCYDNGSIAIVGSRNPGRYSLYATNQFTKDFVDKKIVVVSGGALGIDRACHETALLNRGHTIAVAPCGLDSIYPYKNKDIFEMMYHNGLVISELPPGQKVLKQYFPARNRLISALSDVCLVMEAGLYSGTLHTASFSAAYGKDVFVLPNNIYVENSIGGLKLLQDGAEILLNSEEVIERVALRVFERLKDKFLRNELNHKSDIDGLRTLAREAPDVLFEDDWKKLICDEVSEKPKSIDEISFVLPLQFGHLSILVSELELEGRIENEAGKYFLTFRQC